MPVEVGQKPPEFQLPDHNKTIRSLKDFLGNKTILAFFPGAFTGGCTKEMCTFRDSMQALTGLGGQVVGISVNDPFSNKAFAEANKLQFPLLSDYTRETVKKYGVFHEDFAGLKGYVAAKRSVFVLDKNGIVRYRWISEDPGKQPDFEEIKNQLTKL
jgi:glutaredoxin-dependent peroxiredoxin